MTPEAIELKIKPRNLPGQENTQLRNEALLVRNALLQQGLEPDPRPALDAEALGDGPFVGLLRILPDEIEDRLPVKIAGIRARRVTL